MRDRDELLGMRVWSPSQGRKEDPREEVKKRKQNLTCWTLTAGQA